RCRHMSRTRPCPSSTAAPAPRAERMDPVCQASSSGDLHVRESDVEPLVGVEGFLRADGPTHARFSLGSRTYHRIRRSQLQHELIIGLFDERPYLRPLT